MNTPPAAKRRRLNDALHKPFKSPLRGPLRPIANPSVASPLSSAPVNATRDTPVSKENASPALHRVSMPLKQSVISTSSKSAEAVPADPAILQAIATTNKDTRRMEIAAIHRRQEIDTLQQALAIVSSPKGEELEALTVKWRQAARLAAEEVFAGARDKVNRMGGVGAWRERESEKRSFGSTWDAEPVKNDDRDEDDDDDEDEDEEAGGKEYREVCERDERVEEEGWEYDRRAQEEEEEKHGKDVGADDDSFTMDMMLKTMNIDLELIGYDRRRQTWVG